MVAHEFIEEKDDSTKVCFNLKKKKLIERNFQDWSNIYKHSYKFVDNQIIETIIWLFWSLNLYNILTFISMKMIIKHSRSLKIVLLLFLFFIFICSSGSTMGIAVNSDHICNDNWNWCPRYQIKLITNLPEKVL